MSIVDVLWFCLTPPQQVTSTSSILVLPASIDRTKSRIQAQYPFSIRSLSPTWTVTKVI